MSGAVLWFTGLSGAGKSTLAHAVGAQISAVRPVEILDADEVRLHFSRGLGFSKADRDLNIQRIGFVARLLAKHGVFVITAAISPYADARNEVRRLVERQGTAFIEVFVHAPLETLIARDAKGLYRRALAGEIEHFTGVSDPYEPPEHPEVRVHTDEEPVDASAHAVWQALVDRGLIERRKWVARS